MRFFYDKDKSVEIMQRITKKFGKGSSRGKELHVSDCVYCPVSAYCRITGIERHQTKTAVGLMVFGIIAEDVLASTYTKEEADCQHKTYLNLKFPESIFGHMDIFEYYKFPLEVKATRKRIFKAEDVPKPWVEQLMSYMSMKGLGVGWLVILNIFSTQWMAFKMILNKEDILGWIITMSMRGGKIRKAVDTEDPLILDIHPNEYEFCNYKHACPRRDECKKKWRVLNKANKEEREKRKAKKAIK